VCLTPCFLDVPSSFFPFCDLLWHHDTHHQANWHTHARTHTHTHTFTVFWVSVVEYTDYTQFMAHQHVYETLGTKQVYSVDEAYDSTCKYYRSKNVHLSTLWLTLTYTDAYTHHTSAYVPTFISVLEYMSAYVSLRSSQYSLKSWVVLKELVPFVFLPAKEKKTSPTLWGQLWTMDCSRLH